MDAVFMTTGGQTAVDKAYSPAVKASLQQGLRFLAPISSPPGACCP